MDLVGEFRKMEVDGKLCLVYHNVVKPLPQTHTSNSSDTVAIQPVYLDDLPHQPLFTCPGSRIKSSLIFETVDLFDTIVFEKFWTSPIFDDTDVDSHHVLPLFWCSNKDEFYLDEEEWDMNRVHKVGADYYLCVGRNGQCYGLDGKYEKEAVQAPLEVNYPFQRYSFDLYFSLGREDFCIFCRKRASYMVYCLSGDIYMHVLCVQATIPFFIDQPKRHDHTLKLFPRQDSLICNVCAVVNKFHLTYICAVCNFVVHRDCLNIPQTIRMSRHHHRISFIPSLPFEDGSCGVCRREVDSHYGAYSCTVCSSYAVHTRCALRPDICDGIELEGVPEEDEDVESFKVIADGVIDHFSHGHHLQFEITEVYDDDKFCQACALPIYGGNVYACVECDFRLHEACGEAPRKKFHPLHPHPLKLEVVHGGGYCWACWNRCNGFLYVCTRQSCNFKLDIRCALVSEPFEYGGHQHLLFLALDPKEKAMCTVCARNLIEDGAEGILNCIECDFVICFLCATLPYMARYKHDEHYLTFCHGDEVKDSDWCELCEGKLATGGKRGFYKCDDCSTTLHVHCLLGEDPYLKPDQTVEDKDYGEIHVHRNSSSSRPTCYYCDRYCPYQIYLEGGDYIFCSLSCMRQINKQTESNEQEETQSNEQQSSLSEQEDTQSNEKQSSLTEQEEMQSYEQQSSLSSYDNGE